MNMQKQPRSIRTKLFQFSLGNTLLVLVTACIAFMCYDRISSADQKKTHAVILLDAIVGSLVGPLTFEDADSAEVVLATLNSEQTALQATLLKSDGVVLTSWRKRTQKTASKSPVLDNEKQAYETYIPNIYWPKTLVVQRQLNNNEGQEIGTLKVEFATTDITHRTRNFLLITLNVLIFCICAAVLLSSLFVGNITKPIRRLVETARKIEKTRDYNIRAQEDTLLELHILAKTFNAMLESIKSRDAIKAILDNTDQGLLTMTRSGELLPEKSAKAIELLGPRPSTIKLADYLFLPEEEAKEWFELGIESLQDDILPMDVILAQMPSRIIRNKRNLRIEYKPILDGHELIKILVVITDITLELQACAMEKTQKDTLAAFSYLVKDPHFFSIFLEEANSIVECLDNSDQNLEQKKRKIHTLKGNCALYGMKNFAETLHSMETELGKETRDLYNYEIEQLRITWSPLHTQMNTLLGTSTKTNEIMLSQKDFEQILVMAEDICPDSSLHKTLILLPFDKMLRPLNQVAEKAKPVAKKLGKGDLVFEIDDGDVRISASRWQPFWSVFIHVVNNAIDHGIEDREARIQNGKPAHGTLKLKAIPHNDGCRLEVSDDGRGINWEKLRDMAKKLGMPNQTYDDLTKVLYTDGLSTKEQASMVSGRGVGLGAVAEVCENMSIKYSVESEPNKGTTFCFELPGPLT